MPGSELGHGAAGQALFLTPLLCYVGVVALITYFVRSRSDDAAYFFANKRLSGLQALLSVISSETSVATTVVFPAAGLKGGYVLIWLLLGYIAGRSIVALFYLRTLYESSRLTIYQTMSANHRILEGAYLLAKYISGGARYFVGGYALHQVLGGPVALWIVVVAVCVAAYSLTGGLRAVVVMDQVQSVLIVGTGVILCAFLYLRIPAGTVQIPAFFDLNPSNYSFSPALFIGGAVLSIGSHGADQDLLLRILSTRSYRAAQRSLILSGFGAACLIGLFLSIGYLLQYVSTDLDPKSPLADFVIRSPWPLLKGVFLVLLAAAAMSSLDSTIHSTGAIWKSLMNSSKPGRYWSALSLFIMIGFALLFLSQKDRHPDFLALCMGSMNYVNGGLIGIFTVFTFWPKRMTGAGVVSGLVAGFMTTTVCEWGFGEPIPWTYTVLLASGLSFSSCFLCGLFFPRTIARK
jgi:solute:Na+ symporter, SSS family